MRSGRPDTLLGKPLSMPFVPSACPKPCWETGGVSKMLSAYIWKPACCMHYQHYPSLMHSPPSFVLCSMLYSVKLHSCRLFRGWKKECWNIGPAPLSPVVGGVDCRAGPIPKNKQKLPNQTEGGPAWPQGPALQAGFGRIPSQKTSEKMSENIWPCMHKIPTSNKHS